MTFVRENVYRLLIERSEDDSRETRTLCIDFTTVRGAPVVSAWIETYLPPRWLDDGLREEQRLSTQRMYVYGSNILEKKRISVGDIAAFQVADALGREAVVGREAASLVHMVLSQWFIHGPKHVQNVFAETAPRWWSLVDPKKRE